MVYGCKPLVSMTKRYFWLPTTLMDPSSGVSNRVLQNSAVLLDVEKCGRDTTNIFLRCETWLKVWLSLICHAAVTENQVPILILSE